jgi:hypothetical protein
MGFRKGIRHVLPLHCSMNQVSALPGLITTSVCRMANRMHETDGGLGTYIGEKNHHTEGIANLTSRWHIYESKTVGMATEIH